MSAQVLPPPPPQWVLDLHTAPASRSKSSISSIPDPPGYVTIPGKQQKGAAKAPARKVPTPEEMETLKVKKAWEIAIAPAKQLPMNAIGMYMSGSSLQIFSIMMVFMLFKTPIQAVLNIQRVFAQFETPETSGRLIPVKLAYVACNMLAVALGVWKVGQMGLLPTTRSDWLAWEEPRTALETAVPAPGTLRQY